MKEQSLRDREASCQGFSANLGDKVVLHRHPVMEFELGLDADHVIVDRDAFEAAVRALTTPKKGNSR